MPVKGLFHLLLRKDWPLCFSSDLSDRGLLLFLLMTPILCLTLKKFLTKCAFNFVPFLRGSIPSRDVWNTANKSTFFLVHSGRSLSYIFCIENHCYMKKKTLDFIYWSVIQTYYVKGI